MPKERDFVDQICNDAGALLRQEGITDEVVQRFVQQYGEHLRSLYGGQRPYVPASRNRDREIYLDWKAGMRPNQIAVKHGVDLSTAYRAINRWRKRPKASGGSGLGTDDWNL